MTPTDWILIAAYVLLLLWVAMESKTKLGKVVYILLVTVVVGVVSFSSSAYGRPATTSEVRPFYAVQKHLQAQGVHVEMPTILVMDSTDDCGPLSALAWACAWPDRIVLSKEAAAGNRVLSNLLVHTSRRARQNALFNCFEVCEDTLVGNMHELVHIARFQAYMPFTPWLIGPDDYEEGLADAVSIDQICPLEYRITGRLEEGAVGIPWCKLFQPSYPSRTQRVRWISAIESGVSWPKPKARRWRLDQVTQPVSYGVSKILPGVVQ